MAIPPQFLKKKEDKSEPDEDTKKGKKGQKSKKNNKHSNAKRDALMAQLRGGK